MGKKPLPKAAAAKATPSPPPPPEPKEETLEPEQPKGEQLEGDFVFPDGATYTGQYLKVGGDVLLHGEGLLVSGPESYKGAFEQGLYKQGCYTSRHGAVYRGSFRDNRYHGAGEYSWPDGRRYCGTWHDGLMHGRGEYFRFRVDEASEEEQAFMGFSIDGGFESQPDAQEQARRAFLAAYGGELARGAAEALRDLALRASADGPPRRYLVPQPPAGGEEEKPEHVAERAVVQELVAGPFPDGAALRAEAAQAFAAHLEDGAERPMAVAVWEGPKQSGNFDGARLKKPQLQHVGQAVEFAVPGAEPGAVSLVLLVNASPEYDAAKARWKLVHCETAPLPSPEA